MSFFFFNDTATTEIYTLSLHDALPISGRAGRVARRSLRHRARGMPPVDRQQAGRDGTRDRKSTRLNSSHSQISYAVFCLKKKKAHEWIYDRGVVGKSVREVMLVTPTRL